MSDNKIREIRLIRENPRFRQYPEYKQSGVGWVGKIPNYWQTVTIKHLTKNLDGKRIPLSSEVRADQEKIYPYYGANGIIDYVKDYIFEGEHILIGEDGAPFFDKTREVSLLASGKFWVNNHCHILKNIGTSEPRFIVHCLNSVDYFQYITGSTRDKLTQADLNRIKIPVPPIQEQAQIANFLDRKTKQIDELIHIKERQIALLQEQRTALINQAVTKGLDPNVKMKPSGVEWIGEIPAHWEVKRLKHIAKILPSNVDKHIYPDEIQVRLCNYTDVYYNDYITVDTILKKGSCKESEFAKFALRKGDVIITKDSETPDDIGVPTYVKDDLDSVVCGYHLTMIRPVACCGEFIFRFIQSDRTRRYFEVNSNGITRYGLGKASIENLLLPIPSDSEQTQIANFLNRKTQQIDKLIAAEQRKIQLLKEYRQSLISEAVTGKIDVRNEV